MIGRRAPAVVLLAVLVSGCGSTSPTPAQSAAPVVSPSATPVAAASQAPSAAPSLAPSAGASSGPTDVGTIDPANFVAAIDNPWLPFIPGTVWTYRGIKDGEDAVDVVTVTSDTKVVAGVPCTVVHDELKLGGVLVETTDDWYVQDRDGNVWYFGEATQELEDGKVVSTEGSWETGVNGATPGIFMPATPQVGQSFSQEYLVGHAEDHFVVLLIDAKVKVPLGTFTGALLTAEWTPLEPSVLSEKAYVKGIGEVREADIAGGDEHLELVKVVQPS